MSMVLVYMEREKKEILEFRWGLGFSYIEATKTKFLLFTQ